jgi:pimeloyl-ACP methyl ester carboxylesterase
MKSLNKPIAILATILSIGALYLAACGQAFDRVNAGGPVLRMLQTGEAGPTVVFEAGAGGPLESWVRVQSEVSKFARTISYDRAGNGLSPKGPAPRDGFQIANELHATLQNANALPPYILVGHSLGGPYIRIFAGLYPEDVAGLILVDPTQEDLIAWAKARDTNTSKKHKPSADNEVDCAPATFLQAQEHPVPAHIPVSLITGIGPRVHPAFLPKEMKAEVERDQKFIYPEKLKFHKEWVEQFPRGQLIITENSGHGIPFEEPELIVRAIQQMVSEVSARPSEATR